MTKSTVDKATLLEGLNEDLAHEYAAVVMYNTYAAAVTGVHRSELKAFFAAEIQDELLHAQFLADKITALGGQPVTRAAEVPYTTNSREMLENVLAAETETIKRYVTRRQQAEAFGDYGLASKLDEMILDETTHKEESEKILRGSWQH